jgi:superfamily II helicase
MDGPTARLLSLAKGIKAAEMLPAASAKTLLGIVTGLRALGEAQEKALFLLALDDLAAFGEDCADEFSLLSEAIERREGPLRKTAERLL